MAIEYTSLTEANLPEAHAISNRNLEFDNISLDVFRYKTLGDPDFDPALALLAVSDGKPCGYMMAACRTGGERVNAGVKLFVVDKEFRRQQIASEMLARVEAEAKRRGAENMGIGFTRPNYLTPGLDPRYTEAATFLMRRGYEKCGENFNMDVDLSLSDWSTAELEEKLAKQGVVCRRLRADEKPRLCDAMDAEGFSKGWQYQVMHAAEQDPIAVFIAEKEDRILAFASYDSVRPRWFGPMGTSQTLRGGGIGTVTFLKCLQDMKAVGYDICEIGCVGPLYFYSKIANARVSRIFWGFEKGLG
jgi:GNAT superfamily N-acetyltransferase